jgi:F-type H+-transporting ATPase subunit delta
MAELATIARPYAEALYRAVAPADAGAVAEQLDQLAQVAGNEQVQQFAERPDAQPLQVYQMMILPARMALGDAVRNLLRAVIDNGRLRALPAIAQQYQALVNGRSGISEATIHSAFPIDEAQRADVLAALERRFGRKLDATVVVDPELIGGIRAVVGDEVLDTSVKARLEHMRAALTA